MKRGLFFVSVLPLLLPPGSGLSAQRDWDAFETRVTPVRGGVHMVTTAGGNQAVFPGPDGTLVVDADYAEVSPRLVGAVRNLGDPSNPGIRYLVNTHWHLDHTGGNQAFAEAGAALMAHEAVGRIRAQDQVMPAMGGRVVPAAPPKGRPVVTFDSRMNLAWNGDLVHLVHMAPAHTDGDVIVHFRDADVVHMGDIYFNGMYPFIDVDVGGSLDGMISAVEEVLAHTNPTTLFIPGHGPLAQRNDLESYGAMLGTVRERVRGMLDEGRSREEVIAAHPTADLDPVWVQEAGSGEADFFVGLVYDGMVKGAGGG